MELVDRYIYAVTQKLPQDQREDIAEELQGLIEDMLEERVGNAERTKQDIEEVLLELGNPRILADKYRNKKKFLIGPEIYDAYILVLKIVLISLSSVLALTFLIQTLLQPTEILKYFVDLIVSLVTGLPLAFGWTTFGFAIGEYAGVKKKDIYVHEWKPSQLPPIPDQRRHIKRTESIIGIIIYSIIIVFLAFSGEYFGIWVFNDGFKGTVPFLNDQSYMNYLMLLFLIFGFSLIKEILKLIVGKWTKRLVVYTMLLNLASFTILIFMISGQNFWNPNFMNELVEAGIVSAGTEAYDVVSIIWDQLTFWIIIIFIVSFVWEAVDGFIRARKK